MVTIRLSKDLLIRLSRGLMCVCLRSERAQIHSSNVQASFLDDYAGLRREFYQPLASFVEKQYKIHTLYFPDQYAQVVCLIYHIFQVVDIVEFDKDYKPSRPILPFYKEGFGLYSAWHFWIKFHLKDVNRVKGWQSDVATNPDLIHFKEQRVKIEVRSVVFNACAEAGHDIVYKFMYDTPHVSDGGFWTVSKDLSRRERLCSSTSISSNASEWGLTIKNSATRGSFPKSSSLFSLAETLGRTGPLYELLLKLGIN
ncbi:hypothetical protein F5884DRAFT_756693 [Xylogone sp. PMI_703]|nr:hypothetical protein F5884DRAFT_756693 [Xylogone sp. PMI_703]